MGLSSTGKVEIFADTGIDQWEIVRKKIREEVERKRLKDGDTKILSVDFDEPLIIEMKVIKMPQERLL